MQYKTDRRKNLRLVKRASVCPPLFIVGCNLKCVAIAGQKSREFRLLKIGLIAFDSLYDGLGLANLANAFKITTGQISGFHSRIPKTKEWNMCLQCK